MQSIIQIKMKETPDDLLCIQHNKQPKIILLDPNLETKQRLACEDCLKERDKGMQPKTLEQVINNLYERKKQQSEEADKLIEEGIRYGIEIKEKIEDIQSKIVSQFETFKQTVNKLVQSLQKLKVENLTFSFFEELEKFSKNDNIQNQAMLKQIQQINMNYFGKLKQKMATLPPDLEKLIEDIRKNSQDFYRKNFNELHKPLDLIQIQNYGVEQRDPCYTLAFSKNDNLLFTGCGKQIKIWTFDQGNIKEIKRLNGHVLSVTCILTSSKVKNSFVSGSECGHLNIWKQKSEKEWEKQSKKSQWANSMILNREETLLIVATVNCVIELWDVDFYQNKLTFNTSIPNTHQHTIFDISLNKSENRLVSCGGENRIIVWKKDKEDQEWIQLQEINEDTYGTKVAFISDQSFIWLGCDKKGQNKLTVFELQNGLFKKNDKKQFQFEDDVQNIDFHLTPILHNNCKNVYLLRFKTQVYILKQELGEFSIVTKLQYQTNQIFATLSEDAQYIVTYIEDTLKYEVNRIKWR